MLRERTFRLRGREVHLRELTDLVALHPPDLKDKTEVAGYPERDKSFGNLRLKPETLTAMVPGIPLADVRTFEASGWIFAAREASGDLAQTVLAAKVFIKSDGRLVLSLNRLVVKLLGDPPEAEANKSLEPYAARVVGTFSFSPGLFSVEVAKQAAGDAIDVANGLVASGACEFAEPEFLEVISGR